ncbi:MAG: glycosyl hydrolase family 8 [Reichenbachiella sp.]
MKNTLLLGLILTVTCVQSWAVIAEAPSEGAYSSGIYRNIFKEQGKSQTEIDDKVAQTFNQLFFGNSESESVYIEVADDMAFIKDVASNDIRSEGMSYGMMIAVQLDKKEVFDKLWKFAKTYSQNKSGGLEGYFAWQVEAEEPFGKMDRGPAPDGEEYFVTALYFAAGRWGNGEGIFNYQKEADELLDYLVLDNREGGNVSIFHLEEKQVRFVPKDHENNYTDPSYHLPGFYKLWALWAPRNRDFWTDVAVTSKDFLIRARHAETGLTSEYANFDGTPHETDFNENSHKFGMDSWRVIMNIAVDCHWFGAEEWHTEYTETWLDFFYGKGINDYVAIYSTDGEPDVSYRGEGLIAMNGTAGLATAEAHSGEYLDAFWNAPIPSGQYRYYGGLLHLLALLNSTGNFKIYTPDAVPVDEPMSSSDVTVSSSSMLESSSESSGGEINESSDETHMSSSVIEDELSSSDTDGEMSSSVTENESSESSAEAISPLFTREESIDLSLGIGQRVTIYSISGRILHSFEGYSIDGLQEVIQAIQNQTVVVVTFEHSNKRVLVPLK